MTHSSHNAAPLPSFDPSRLVAEEAWLQRLCLHLIRQGDDADDLRQETMMAALQRAPAGLPKSQLRHWMAAVATRLRADRLRSQSRRSGRETEVARLAAMEAGSQPDDPIQAATLRRVLTESVMDLDDGMRDAVLLHYFEGLDHCAVAGRLGITETASRKRVSRGLQQLRRDLKERGGDDRALWSLAAAAASVPSRAQVALGLVAKVAAILLVLGLGTWTALSRRSYSSPGNKAPVEAGGEALAGIAGGTPALLAPSTASPHERAAIESVQPSDMRGGSEEVPAFPTPAEGDGVSLEIELLWADTHEPVVGEPVILYPFSAPEFRLFTRHGNTDAAGKVQFEDIYPGSIRFATARTPGRSWDAVAGESLSETFSLKRGGRVHGRVTTSSGHAVPGAAMEISLPTGNRSLGFPIAVTDADGRYEIEGLEETSAIPGRLLAARDPRFGPSMRKEFGIVSDLELDFVLEAEEKSASAREFRGVVLDPAGRPIQDARVQVNVPPGQVKTRLVDGRKVAHAPFGSATRTDAAGEFVFKGWNHRAPLIEVRTFDHAPYSRRLGFDERNGPIEITLEAGAEVEGTVLLQLEEAGDGRLPVKSARILVGRYGEFLSHELRTDEDGRFRLAGLPTGEVKISAFKRGVGQVDAEVMATLDETASLGLLLPWRELTPGQLLDEAGSPLAGWRVRSLAPTGAVSSPSATTDEDGRFQLAVPGPAHTDLEVGPPPTVHVGFLWTAERVLPSADSVQVVVPDSRRASSSVTGRLSSPGGSGNLGDAKVTLWLVDDYSGYFVTVNPATGSFTEPTIAAGHYRIHFEVAGRPLCVRHFEAAVGEAVDLGDIELSVGGRIECLATLDYPAADLGHVDLRRIDSNGWPLESFTLEVDGRRTALEGLTRPMEPGTHTIAVAHNSSAWQELTVEVRDGETTLIEPVLALGSARNMMVHGPDGLPYRGRYRVEILDEAGGLYSPSWTTSLGNRSSVMLSYLGLGEYTIRVTDLIGRTAEGRLEVTEPVNLGADEIALTLTLPQTR